MQASVKALSIAAVMCVFSTVSVADSNAPAKLVESSVSTLQSFLQDESADWFRGHLRNAMAIMIIPSMIKAGFVLGAGGGDGVLVARDPKTGTWSQPGFYQIGGFSVGAQIGGKKSRVILIVRTERGLESFLQTTGKLGAGGAIAVGSVGSGAAMNTAADILTFSRSKGAFAGVSLEGSTVGVHNEFNHAYYGKTVSPRDILINRTVTNVASDRLTTVLNAIR